MINIILLVAVVVAGMGIYRAYREYKVPVTRARGRWALVLRYRFELLIIGAAALGSLWGQEYPALIAFAVLLPVLWSFAESRIEALIVTGFYYLAASRDLPQSAGIFFDVTAPLALGYGLWLLAAALNAAVWAGCWQPKPAHRAIAAQFALVLTAIPPIGIVGWANPLTSAGWLFPYCGVLGLLFTMLLIAILVSRSYRMFMNFGQVVIAGSLLANVYCSYFVPAGPPPYLQNWVSYDSHFAKLQSGSSASFFSRVQGVQDIAAMAQPHQVILLPESILPETALSNGFSEPLIETAAKTLHVKDALVLIGTEATGENGVDNVLMPLGERGINLVQRVPVPVGMWRPWSKLTYTTNFFGSGVAVIRGVRAAYLICYEQLLVYPVVLSAVRDPRVILGASNDWWARDTSIPKIQQAAIMSWGRLLGIPVLNATNF